MEYADVEHAWHWWRIRRHQILDNLALCITVAVQRDGVIREGEGLGFARGEDSDIVRQSKTSRDPIRRVVIPQEQIDGDRIGRKATHLANEEEPGLKVAPIAVVEIARDDEKIHRLLDGPTDQGVECLPRRSPDSLGEASFLTGETEERTVQVNVRRVEKSE